MAEYQMTLSFGSSVIHIPVLPEKLTVKSPGKNSPSRAVKSAPKRSGKPAAASSKTHTVVKGDCLWAIAQKYYGDGSRYPELYQKNKATIDAKNQGTENPKYTIYPGQKLIL